jgi:hypothetical protein
LKYVNFAMNGRMKININKYEIPFVYIKD